MLQTPNYQLKKIELTDSPPDITVLNHNWDMIDNQLDSQESLLITLINARNGINSNAVINGNFDIWQRGTSFSSISGNRYYPDRWLTGFASSITGTISRGELTAGEINKSNYYFSIDVANRPDVDSYCVIKNNMEGVSNLQGEVVTISFYARTTGDSKTLQVGIDQHFGTGGSTTLSTSLQSVVINNTWQLYSLNIEIPSVIGKVIGGANNRCVLTIHFPKLTAFKVDITQVQICRGSVALPYQPRQISDELQLCRRYFQQHSTNNINALELSPPMRIAPTITGSASPYSYDAEY